MSESEPSVFWHNIEKPRSKWVKRIRQGLGLKAVEIPYSSSILVTDIDTLDDTGLREALEAQYSARVENRGWSVIPIVQQPGNILDHTRRVPRGSMFSDRPAASASNSSP